MVWRTVDVLDMLKNLREHLAEKAYAEMYAGCEFAIDLISKEIADIEQSEESE